MSLGAAERSGGLAMTVEVAGVEESLRVLTRAGANLRGAVLAP